MKIGKMFRIFLVFGACSIFFSFPARGDVEWKIVKQLKFDSKPLDLVPSLDGRNIFILLRGKILIYSLSENKVSATIPVEEAVDGLRLSPNAEFLIVKSSSQKTVKIIQWRIVQDINVSGLPYQGPKDASVTIAVFSDYQ